MVKAKLLLGLQSIGKYEGRLEQTQRERERERERERKPTTAYPMNTKFEIDWSNIILLVTNPIKKFPKDELY